MFDAGGKYYARLKLCFSTEVSTIILSDNYVGPQLLQNDVRLHSTHPLEAEEVFYDFLTLLPESCWPGGCSAPTGRWTQAVGCAHVWKRPPAAC